MTCFTHTSTVTGRKLIHIKYNSGVTVCIYVYVMMSVLFVLVLVVYHWLGGLPDK